MLAFVESRIKEEIFSERFVDVISSYIDQIDIDEVSLMLESGNEQVFYERARKRNNALSKVHSGVIGMINKIILFLKNIFNKVKNILTRQDIARDFEGSKTKKFYINYDANQKIKEADGLMTKGNKIIDSIRKGTPISKASFNVFKLEAKDFCDKTPKLVKVGAATSAVAVTGVALWSHRLNIIRAFNKLEDTLNRCKESVSDKMTKLSTEVDNSIHLINTNAKKVANKINKSGKTSNKETHKIYNPDRLEDNEQVKQIAETLSIMSQISSAFGRVTVGFANIIDGIMGNKNESVGGN